MRAWRSLDHLIRPPQHRRWNREADGLGRLEVDDEIEPVLLLDRKVSRRSTLQDALDVLCEEPAARIVAQAVGGQRPSHHDLAVLVDGWQLLRLRGFDD